MKVEAGESELGKRRPEASSNRNMTDHGEISYPNYACGRHLISALGVGRVSGRGSNAVRGDDALGKGQLWRCVG